MQNKAISPRLKDKCINAAISQLKAAQTRDKANTVVKSWEVLRNTPEFSKAIQDKLTFFKERGI